MIIEIENKTFDSEIKQALFESEILNKTLEAEITRNTFEAEITSKTFECDLSTSILVSDYKVKVSETDNRGYLEDKLVAGEGITITKSGIADQTLIIENSNSSAVWGNITGNIEDQLDLKEKIDLKADSSDLQAHKEDTSNPHEVTKSQVGLSNVQNVDTTNTSNISDSLNKRFITDAQKVVLENTTGTNTGDQDLSGLVPKTTKVNGYELSGDVTISKADVGLGNVKNLDQTDPSNIIQDSTHRFVSDAEKSTWNSKQNALGYTPENVANKSTSTSLGTSNTLYPTQNAVKSYTDTGLSGKVDKVAGKGLSTNDYTTTEKNKLSGIQAGADVTANALIDGGLYI